METESNFTLLIIILITIAFLFAGFAATYLAYNGFVSKAISKALMNVDQDKFKLHLPDIYIADPYLYICRTSSTIFCRYYIQNLGMIPRFSKFDKKVNQYYIECLNKHLNK